jgi:predicted membrane-bound spermidine synthase
MPSLILLVAVALEGYVVLAVELLAIRQLTPYVGNATDTVAIVIAAVLLPLAFGYEAGGRAGLNMGDEAGVRRCLTGNLLVAALILGLGLSHPSLAAFFEAIEGLGVTHRLVQTALYASLFLVYPIYLLGQTIPLVGHCFTYADLPRSTGKMLFFSTLGSFMGSVVSTLVLMSFLGVHNTVIVTLGILLLLAGFVGWRSYPRHTAATAGLALGVLALNNGGVMQAYGVVSNNQYSQVQVQTNPSENSRLLVVNNSPSSKVAAQPEHRFAYVNFINTDVIGKLDSARPHRILVIGAGGFTIGLEDRANLYTYVDIDPALRQVSEEHFLRQKLTPNKNFVPESARAFLRRSRQTYDVVVLDTYTNRLDIPADLATRESFAAVRQALAPGGRVAMNIIASPTFADRFSRSIDATIRSVFPFVTRQAMTVAERDGVASILYLYRDQPDDRHEVYTDDKNRVFLDR